MHTSDVPSGHKAAFTASRLAGTASTFLITEYDDVYDEHPFIYAKIVPSARAICIIDTGCGGASNDPEAEITSLREFIETAGVPENDGQPLNDGGEMSYVVVCTHCHYDHILGVEVFAKDSPVLVSGRDPSFLDPARLPAHSLCRSLGIPTPSYTPTFVSHLSPVTTPSAPHASLGLSILHTPGHTPDELALWDADARMLYVGDTLYEWAAIMFPREGSIVDWLRSVDFLIAFVADADADVARRGEGTVARISAGHVTAGKPALQLLEDTKSFMLEVLSGKEGVKRRFEKRGETFVEYVQQGGRFSLITPERLVLEARAGSA